MLNVRFSSGKTHWLHQLQKTCAPISLLLTRFTSMWLLVHFTVRIELAAKEIRNAYFCFIKSHWQECLLKINVRIYQVITPTKLMFYCVQDMIKPNVKLQVLFVLTSSINFPSQTPLTTISAPTYPPSTTTKPKSPLAPHIPKHSVV